MLVLIIFKPINSGSNTDSNPILECTDEILELDENGTIKRETIAKISSTEKSIEENIYE